MMLSRRTHHCQFRCLPAVLSLTILFSLSSCSLTRSKYQRSAESIPTAYAHADNNAKVSVDRWWLNFGDPHLDTLIDAAMANNNDLALAALNVRAARLQTHLAVINPIVSAGYTYDYATQLNGAAPATQFHSVTASAGYEIDLWDQLAATKDVARWEARATEQDQQMAAVVLIATTVSLFYQLAELNYQIGRGEESIAYAQQTLHLVKVQATAGSGSDLDVAVSERNLQSQLAAQIQLIELRVEARNALTVLLDGTPLPDSAEPASIPDNPPPAVASDLPASLLDRRPDLRAAEMRLRETLAQTDATRLSFYPNLGLTGSLGTASTGLSELVSNPLGSLAVALTAPFIQFNQAKFATALARTQYELAALQFRKTLLQALTDVDNALSARTQLRLQGDQFERSLQSAIVAEHLNHVRYRAGAVSLQSWLDAQASRRSGELALSTNRLARLLNYAALCQALGGGT